MDGSAFYCPPLSFIMVIHPNKGCITALKAIIGPCFGTSFLVSASSLQAELHEQGEPEK